MLGAGLLLGCLLCVCLLVCPWGPCNLQAMQAGCCALQP